MRDIIGVYSLGYGAGKDSVANVLCMDFKYVIWGFSETMKAHIYHHLARYRFDTMQTWLKYCEEHKYDTEEQEGFWVRKLLQGYGQFFRHNQPDYWINEWLPVANQYEKVVVPNVRFPNEAEKIKSLGGKLIKVIRPGVVPDKDPSELSLANWEPDHVILNSSTLSNLRTKVIQIMANGNDTVCQPENQSPVEKLPVS